MTEVHILLRNDEPLMAFESISEANIMVHRKEQTSDSSIEQGIYHLRTIPFIQKAPDRPAYGLSGCGPITEEEPGR